MVIFLDTYAIMEIDKGNPNYKKYTLSPGVAVTTLLNLIEVYFVYLKKFGEDEADRIYAEASRMVVPVSEQIIKGAMKFKLANQRKRYSMADCVGYNSAMRFGANFVTGDFAFKGLDNVEFVK